MPDSLAAGTLREEQAMVHHYGAGELLGVTLSVRPGTLDSIIGALLDEPDTSAVRIGEMLHELTREIAAR